MDAMQAATANSASSRVPLVVDLDGTLLRSDMLIESAFAELGQNPGSAAFMVTALLRGKAALKHRIAQTSPADIANLPWEPLVVEAIGAARAEGRPVYLASASNERLVEAIAAHLGLFDGWFASSATLNLGGRAKAARLVAAFGERGFDYIGNSTPDLHIWRQARRAISIGASASLRRRLAKSHDDIEHLSAPRPSGKSWLKLLRVHHYSKNALILVPLLASHSFSAHALLLAAMAMIAFSFCASSIYVLNDLVDLSADRAHRSKRNRPLASGAIPPAQAMLVIPFALAAGIAMGAAVSLPFLAALLGYVGLAGSYTFWLKRKMMIDVVALAGLYSARVMAGAVAIQVVPSPWLITFSMFIFTSLALIKRYVELAAQADANLPGISNRDYQGGDLDVVMAMAAAAGFNAVTVFAFYVSSDAVGQLYRRPELLWLFCPLLLYWIGRLLILAHRRLVDDDPIVFALKDRASYAVAICMGAIAIAASV